MPVSFRMAKADWKRTMQQFLMGLKRSALQKAECVVEVADGKVTFTAEGLSARMPITEAAEGNVTMPLHIFRGMAATARATGEEAPLFSATDGEASLADYSQTSERIRVVPMSSLSALYVPAKGGDLHVLALAMKYGVEEVSNAGLATRLEEARERKDRIVASAALSLGEFGVESSEIGQLVTNAIVRKADSL